MILLFQLLSFLYSTKALKLFSWIKNIITLSFGLGAFMAYLVNSAAIIQLYDIRIVSLFFSTSVILGVFLITVLCINRKFNSIPYVLFMMFAPSSILTYSGVNALFLFLIILGFSYLERSHRQRVVQTLALFDKDFSPLFEKRFINKNKYRAYSDAYFRLGFINKDDYTLVREVDIKNRNVKDGIGHRTLFRTFKIKGVIGNTTVVDNCWTVPQKTKFGLSWRL